MIHPTLRQLEYLVAVADHGGFHRAAEACHVSQPGLSAQIKQLEESLGVQLIERDRRRVLLTPAGRAVTERARGILRSARELEDEARVHARPLSGTLRLGVIPTIAPYWLPRVLPGVRAGFPDLQLRLVEETTERLLEALDEGGLDLLLLALEAELDDLETLPLASDPFRVAMARSHPLAARRRLRESDLANQTVLLLEDGH